MLMDQNHILKTNVCLCWCWRDVVVYICIEMIILCFQHMRFSVHRMGENCCNRCLFWHRERSHGAKKKKKKELLSWFPLCMWDSLLIVELTINTYERILYTFRYIENVEWYKIPKGLDAIHPRRQWWYEEFYACLDENLIQRCFSSLHD